jgi:sn-glycerol 3-phosphate transport system substrate-binding protein
MPAQAQTEIQWWHSMTGRWGEWVNDLAKDFNASQKDYKVVPTFKGSYPESMTAAIAAFRAGNAPHILQVFEVGTATMMASKGAIVPVGKVMKPTPATSSTPRPTCPRWRATTPRPTARC